MCQKPNSIAAEDDPLSAGQRQGHRVEEVCEDLKDWRVQLGKVLHALRLQLRPARSSSPASHQRTADAVHVLVARLQGERSRRLQGLARASHHVTCRIEAVQMHR